MSATRHVACGRDGFCGDHVRHATHVHACGVRAPGHQAALPRIVRSQFEHKEHFVQMCMQSHSNWTFLEEKGRMINKIRDSRMNVLGALSGAAGIIVGKHRTIHLVR